MSLHAERQDEVAVVQDSVIKSQHSITNCQRESECGKIATKIGHLSEHEGIQSENGNADESADNSSIQGERPRSPVPSVVSMKSDKSMGLPPDFSGEVQQHIKIHLDRPNSPGSMLDSEEDLQNFYIASEMTDGGEEVLCAVCTKRAGKFCLTCVAHFCEIHVRQHYTAPALQRHRLVGVSTDWKRHLCDLHHRALEFFCQTDQVSICACCAVDDHRQHDVVQQGGHKSVQRKKTQIPPNIDIPPPGQVSITAVKPEAVFLKWVNPEGLSGPLKFRVSWRCRLNTHHRFIDVKNSEVQIQGLIPGEEYAFTVATLSSDGGHSFGVSITASTEVPPPKNLTVETKVTSVSVNWKKPAGVVEVSYLLTLSRDEEHQTLHTDSEEHIFNHLKLEMEYSISVLTALSTGAQSKPVFKVISTCIPIPGNLEVGSVTAASASLSWSMPSEMDEIPHSFLVSYHSKATEPQTISTDTCSAVLTGLTPDSEHSVSICTKLQDGRQGQPAVTSIQTGIPPPEMIEFTSVQPHAVALRWEPPKGLAGLYRYKVSWRGGGMLQSLEVSTRNVEARGLAPGEKYEFTVATLCDNDRQSPHAVATVRTEIPVPEHVRVESDTTSLSVKWEKPGGLKEVSYQLTLSRNEECQTISTDSLEHCFSALSPGTKYSVSVSTVLNDCQSKPVWNTTCTTIPVPEELVVDSVTLTSANISCMELTTGVLKERVQLQACVNNLIERIEFIELKQEELKQTQAAIQDNQEKIKKCEKFTYEVDVPYKEKCKIKTVIKIRKETRTDEDLKRRFEEQTDKSKSYEEMMKKAKEDLEKASAEKCTLVHEAYQSIMKLQEIASERESVFTLVHLDFLIEKMQEMVDTEKVRKLEEMQKTDEAKQSAVNYVKVLLKKPFSQFRKKN